jgi:hypothetical protein
MLGRFVCAAERLPDLGTFVRNAPALPDIAVAYLHGRHGSLTTIVDARETSDASLAELDQAIAHISAFPKWYAIDSLELRMPVELSRVADVQSYSSYVELVSGRITDAGLGPMTLFFELPAHQDPPSDLLSFSSAACLIAAVAKFNRSSKPQKIEAGVKLRCGGTERKTVPSSPQVASVICARRDAGVFWKATAGLHHPFRHVDPTLGVPVHGFINLLTAAVMAGAHYLHVDRVQTILEDDDSWHFRFTNEALTWRELAATVPQIVAARERSLRSFGSCSIDEPWRDLMVLGLL